MLPTLQEKHTHGTTTFPLQVYSHHDKDGFYSVAQHWHEELEWVYVETGVLELTVRGKSYLLHPGEFCFVNSGELHEIRSTGESFHHAVVFRASFLDFELYDTCQHQFIRPVTSHRLSFPTPALTCSKQPGADTARRSCRGHSGPFAGNCPPLPRAYTGVPFKHQNPYFAGTGTAVPLQRPGGKCRFCP